MAESEVSLSEINGDSSSIQVNCRESKACPRRCNTLGALFSSASAQDFRTSEIEKQIHAKASPRGVLELRKDNTDTEAESPRKNGQQCVNLCIGSKPLSNLKQFVRQWRKKSLKRFYTFPRLMPRLTIIKSKRRDTAKFDLSSHVDADICYLNVSWKIFLLSELKTATNDFSRENLLGRGGFAEVYKGCLKDGELVAVKRLTRGTHEEKTANFLSELGIIAHLNNPNTARLIGYGVEGGLHLVLKLSSNGSLGSMLNGPKEKLTWSIRYKIALGTADGLSYLHEDCQRRIIHRDIKPDNILLTENYDAQISDFGVAMWLPRQCTHHTVFKSEGTFGYFAPEYIMHGIVDEKIDVFSFGVLLLELITGRRALDNSRQSLLIWAKPLLHKNDLKKLIDPCLGDDYDREELDRMALTASLCVDYTPILRPAMSQAVVLLKGDDEQAKDTNQRQMHRTYSEELLDAKEYNSTKYLNDLKQHRLVAFAV
ncbi:hypothetical protein Drorol1_Dr00024837 [Drosera rotundifolia]